MKKCLILTLTLFLSALLPSLFPIFWRNCISVPALTQLDRLGSLLPFSLLEWGLTAWIAWKIVALILRLARGNFRLAFRKLASSAASLAMIALILTSALWLPLYGIQTGAPSATSIQLASCCEALIQELNLSAPDFSRLPDDLPAKFAQFPFWMEKLGISGFYSFFTGEALISPNQPNCAIPFVAVHESMHGSGIADEGQCNIAAYEECMRRGGLYADSARLWALRYLLADLHQEDLSAYNRCKHQMQPRTDFLFRQIGGEYASPVQTGIQAAFAELGGASTRNYEILSRWLAAQFPQ